MVIPIHSRRIFSKEEAQQLLPIIKRMTARAVSRFAEAKDRIACLSTEEPLYIRLHGRMEFIVKQWAMKIANLGCEPRGVWFVNFDAGDGWFSWRHGDEDLGFFHSHKSFSDDLNVPDKLPT